MKAFVKVSEHSNYYVKETAETDPLGVALNIFGCVFFLGASAAIVMGVIKLFLVCFT